MRRTKYKLISVFFSADAETGHHSRLTAGWSGRIAVRPPSHFINEPAHGSSEVAGGVSSHGYDMCLMSFSHLSNTLARLSLTVAGRTLASARPRDGSRFLRRILS